MNARKKLNGAYMLGSLIVAAVVGSLFGSWIIFFIAVIILIALAINGGDIRL